eukprot:3916741-Rhodomonas_salina.2
MSSTRSLHARARHEKNNLVSRENRKSRNGKSHGKSRECKVKLGGRKGKCEPRQVGGDDKRVGQGVCNL